MRLEALEGMGIDVGGLIRAMHELVADDEPQDADRLHDQATWHVERQPYEDELIDDFLRHLAAACNPAKINNEARGVDLAELEHTTADNCYSLDCVTAKYPRIAHLACEQE